MSDFKNLPEPEPSDPSWLATVVIVCAVLLGLELMIWWLT